MKKISTEIISMCVLLSLTLCLAGCGGDDSNDEYSEYDIVITVILQSGGLTEGQRTLISDCIGPAVGDVNGDGEVNVYMTIADTRSMDVIMLYNTNTSCSLFILTDGPLGGVPDETSTSTALCTQGFYDSLMDFGIEPDSEFDSRVQVNTTGLFEELGLSEQRLYASIIDWSEVGKSGQKQTQAAIDAINAILAS